VTGISGLSFVSDSSRYTFDVTFAQGSYSSVFATQYPTFVPGWQSVNSRLAAEAIQNIFITNSVGGNAIAAIPYATEINVPYQPYTLQGNDFVYSWDIKPAWGVVGSSTELNTEAPGLGYAVFSNESITAVPLPAAAWLLISGLAGISAFARRRRSTT
jgi:hypothetical protein